MLPSAEILDESHDRLSPLKTPKLSPKVLVFEFYVEQAGVKTPCRLTLGWDGVAARPYELVDGTAHPDGHRVAVSRLETVGAWSDEA